MLYYLAFRGLQHLPYTTFSLNQMSLIMRQPVLGVSDQVSHKLGCTATEDDQRLEMLDLGSGGITLSM